MPRPLRAALGALATVALLLVPPGSPATARNSGTQVVIKANHTAKGKASFPVRGKARKTLRSAKVKRAVVKVGARKRPVKTSVVRKGAAAGKIALPLPAGAAPSPAAAAELIVHVVPQPQPAAAPVKTPTSGGGGGGGGGGGSAPAGTPLAPVVSAVDELPGLCSAILTRFVAGKRPPACWRPYSDDSPFNRRIPSNPRLLANSDAVVSRMLGFGKLENMGAGDGGTGFDYGVPTYFATASDPEFTLHCTEPWGRCPIEGMKINVPDEARAATGTDGHMSIVDTASGWEYDLWTVQSKPQGGGRLTFGWGGRTRIDGDGTGSGANAANYGGMAGIVRVEELMAGKIDHALIIAVSCDSAKFVYPAEKSGRPCTEIGKSNTDAPAMGQRFQLAMSDAQIAALAVPAWQKTILTAMAEYGAYVSDTGSSWAIDVESGQVYNSYGAQDQWLKFAKDVGLPYYAPDKRYLMKVSEGVDWSRYLRALDPCTASGTC